MSSYDQASAAQEEQRIHSRLAREDDQPSRLRVRRQPAPNDPNEGKCFFNVSCSYPENFLSFALDFNFLSARQIAQRQRRARERAERSEGLFNEAPGRPAANGKPIVVLWPFLKSLS